MLLGLRTAIYPAPDLDAARQWYSEVLGVCDPFGNRLGIIENPNFDPGAVR